MDAFGPEAEHVRATTRQGPSEMLGRNAEPGFDATADDTRRAPGGTTSHATLPGASAVSKPALSIRRCGMNEPVPLVPIRACEHGESNQARGRRAGSRSVSASPGLSIRLLASEQDIEDTLTLTLAAHAESRHRDHPLDPERRRRFLAERFLADPVRYGFFVARHGERAVGMLTCHAQKLYFSDVTVVSCLSFYVLASCRRTLLGGRVAVRLMGAGQRWAMNRGAVEWQMHVTNGIHIVRTDRMLRRLGFRQTGGNYVMGLTGEESR